MALPTGVGSRAGMDVRIVLDRTALNNLLSGRTGDLRRVMAGFAGRATRNARTIALQRFDAAGPYAHRRTGRYVRSIHSTLQGNELRISADVPYAAAIELGANPHPIYPRRAGRALLHFYWDVMGDWVSLPAVNHPGNRPYLILTDAVLQTAQQMGF